MTDLERKREIQKVNRFVRAAEAEIDAMAILPRNATRYPFDIVGLATVSKAFALAKACLKLLSFHSSDEAFGLSRSIVECANNLRYLTEKSDSQNKRVRNFVNQYKADKAFWAHHALELFSGRPEEKEIRDYMQQESISPDTKPASRHWSGERGFIWDTVNIDHPLDGPVTPKHKKISYAADYFQTSSFVHCSLPAIDNYAVDEAKPFRVSTSTGLHETSQSTLFIVFLYLHSTIAYALFGMNLDRPPKLDAAFQKTLNLLKPVPRRHERTGT
ncbi:MAG TPA: DUF5677 domain-containing protein [Terriglobales bacterium]|nr:DUF5677 domain-containing protein [Terriglobales bacterium]